MKPLEPRFVEPYGTPPIENSLGTRFMIGSGWLLLGRTCGRAVELVKVVVVARLLAPEDYGLFALALSLMLALQSFTETGAKSALLQKDGDAEGYYATVWLAHVLRGAGLATMTVLMAPLVADMLGVPELTSILRVLALAIVLQGAVSMGLVTLEKHLRSDKIFALELTASVVSLMTLAVLALRLRSVWALVLANVVGAAVRLALSFTMTSWRPALHFSWHQYRDLAAFGGWVSLSWTALFLWQQADKVIIGKVLGPYDLGLYLMAFRMAELPLGQISVAINFLAFPAFSQLQREPSRMRSAFLRVSVVVLAVLFPAFAFLFVYADQIVAALLGPLWRPVPSLVKVLALGTAVTAVDNLMTPVIFALGQPKLEALKSLSRLGVLLLLVPAAARYHGLLGACWGVAFASFIPLLFAPLTLRLTGISLREMLAPFLFAALLGAVVVGVGLATPRSLPAWAAIVFGCTVGGAAVGAVAYWLSRTVVALAPLQEVLTLVQRTARTRFSRSGGH